MTAWFLGSKFLGGSYTFTFSLLVDHCCLNCLSLLGLNLIAIENILTFAFSEVLIKLIKAIKVI